LECKTFQEIFGTAENFCEKVLYLFCLNILCYMTLSMPWEIIDIRFHGLIREFKHG
jgi:hypothetical protein